MFDTCLINHNEVLGSVEEAVDVVEGVTVEAGCGPPCAEPHDGLVEGSGVAPT